MSTTNWSIKSPEWSADESLLLLADDIDETDNVTVQKLIEASNRFPIKFPLDTSRLKFLKDNVSGEILERNIHSAYPLIHENILELCCKFILHKREHGSNIEKKFYKNINLKQFINRLLTKRAVTFIKTEDEYKLLSGEEGYGKWETIGTDKESRLNLESCLSYDEIKISALLSVSSFSYFINSGDRHNSGVVIKDREKIEDEGIIIGLIGPRLEKVDFMEYQEIMITQAQNTLANGYGSNASPSVHKLFSNLYGEKCYNYDEYIKMTKSANPQRFVKLKDERYFDNHFYQKRLSISFDTLLLEADERAGLENRSAYIHVVGIGLGVWKISPHQSKVFMDTFAQRIAALGPHLYNVSDISFAYIPETYCGAYRNGDIFPISGHPRTGIKIHFSKRNPHQKLNGEDNGKLLVVSYAWDGNALPGNEFWIGMTGATGDSAAASSTQITEIHNPHINPLVSADRLRIVTSSGLVTLKQYRDRIREKSMR